jgi:hypothetical protein
MLQTPERPEVKGILWDEVIQDRALPYDVIGITWWMPLTGSFET